MARGRPYSSATYRRIAALTVITKRIDFVVQVQVGEPPYFAVLKGVENDLGGFNDLRPRCEEPKCRKGRGLRS